MRLRSVAVDLALVLLLAVAAFLEAAFHADDGYRGTAAPVLGGLVAALGPVPLMARRSRPVLVLGLVSALVSLPHLVLSYDPVFVGGACAVVIAAESAGRYARRPGAAWSLLLPLAGLAVTAVAVPGFAADAGVCGALVLAGWGLGVLIRALLQRRTALAGELAARAEAETLLTERAIAAERTRIARDLHDVIAHCVGVMVLQAGAARLRIPTDPAASAEGIGTIEQVGHEALVELQRVLGLLRGAADDGDVSIAAIEQLVERATRAGLTVRLHVDGDPSALPAGLDRSLYRVIQESLTNALKHGSDPQVDLRLAVSGTRVELEIVNPAAPTARPALPGGHGQAGMRERIAAFGGALEAGVEAGRYRVHAVVPVGEPA